MDRDGPRLEWVGPDSSLLPIHQPVLAIDGCAQLCLPRAGQIAVQQAFPVPGGQKLKVAAIEKPAICVEECRWRRTEAVVRRDDEGTVGADRFEQSRELRINLPVQRATARADPFLFVGDQ